MKLIDALQSETLTWENMDWENIEGVKEFETDGYIIQREKHVKPGYKGNAYTLQLFDKDLHPYESLSWFGWHEVNSLAKMKELFRI